MDCKNCQIQNSDNSEFCEDCGEPLSEQDLGPPTICFEQVGSNFPPDEFQETRLKYLESNFYEVVSKASSADHIGFVKDEQEDRVLCKERKYLKHNLSLFITGVADGMGGTPGGENCAEIGLNEFALSIYEILPSAEAQVMPRVDFIIELEKLLSKNVSIAISKANARVRKYLSANKDENGNISGGATIVVAAILVDNLYGRIKVFGYSQGDSRGLLVLSDGSSINVTNDHVIEGKPIRYLGAKDSIGLGSFDYEAWASDSKVLFPKAITFYTDGLWQMINELRITELIKFYHSRRVNISNELIVSALTVTTPAGAIGSAEGKVTKCDDNLSAVTLEFYEK